MAHTIGERIAELRQRRGISQQELADAVPLSCSYVSLIETGKRNPRPRVVGLLADRLGCTTDYLLTGRGVADTRALELDLRFAELALRAGDTASAQERFQSVRDTATELGEPYEAEALAALWGLGRCALALGELKAAAEMCEAVAAAPVLPPGARRPMVLLTVCRAYLESGDVNRAVDVGETALGGAGLDEEADAEELAELTATVALCYYERGDLTRASVLLDDVLDLADATGSLRARGAGMWNKALVAEAAGDLGSAERLIDAALAAYAEAGRPIHTAMLRADAASLLLRVGRCALDVVDERLRDAISRLRDANAPDFCVAEAQADLAICRLRQGNPLDAARLAKDALDIVGDQGTMDSARIRAVLAEALLAVDKDEEAIAECHRTAQALRACGAPLRAKGAVVSLAEALYRSGRPDEAIQMYRVLAEPWASEVPHEQTAARVRQLSSTITRSCASR